MSQFKVLDREFNVGTIFCSILRKQAAHDGRSWDEFTVRIEKRYKSSKVGEWHTTSVFRLDELPKLATAAMKAFEHASIKERFSTEDQKTQLE